MRRTTLALPIEPAPPLSQRIKGQHAPWANPEPRTLSLCYNKDDIMQRRRTYETTPIDTAGLQVLRR